MLQIVQERWVICISMNFEGVFEKNCLLSFSHTKTIMAHADGRRLILIKFLNITVGMNRWVVDMYISKTGQTIVKIVCRACGCRVDVNVRAHRTRNFLATEFWCHTCEVNAACDLNQQNTYLSIVHQYVWDSCYLHMEGRCKKTLEALWTVHAELADVWGRQLRTVAVRRDGRVLLTII